MSEERFEMECLECGFISTDPQAFMQHLAQCQKQESVQT